MHYTLSITVSEIHYVAIHCSPWIKHYSVLSHWHVELYIEVLLKSFMLSNNLLCTCYHQRPPARKHEAFEWPMTAWLKHMKISKKQNWNCNNMCHVTYITMVTNLYIMSYNENNNNKALNKILTLSVQQITWSVITNCYITKTMFL